MYPLHFMWRRVQPDPPLSGCYYGDASRPKTKAEKKNKQSQTRAPGRALTTESGLAAEARASFLSLCLSLFVSHLHAESVNIDLENKQIDMTNLQ